MSVIQQKMQHKRISSIYLLVTFSSIQFIISKFTKTRPYSECVSFNISNASASKTKPTGVCAIEKFPRLNWWKSSSFSSLVSEFIVDWFSTTYFFLIILLLPLLLSLVLLLRCYISLHFNSCELFLVAAISFN